MNLFGGFDQADHCIVKRTSKLIRTVSPCGGRGREPGLGAGFRKMRWQLRVALSENRRGATHPILGERMSRIGYDPRSGQILMGGNGEECGGDGHLFPYREIAPTSGGQEVCERFEPVMIGLPIGEQCNLWINDTFCMSERLNNARGEPGRTNAALSGLVSAKMAACPTKITY